MKYKQPLSATLYLDNTNRFAGEMVRCVEQECQEEDEASVPEEKNTKCTPSMLKKAQCIFLCKKQSEQFWSNCTVRLRASGRLREKEGSKGC